MSFLRRLTLILVSHHPQSVRNTRFRVKFQRSSTDVELEWTSDRHWNGTEPDLP